jgi:hypothetical protein
MPVFSFVLVRLRYLHAAIAIMYYLYTAECSSHEHPNHIHNTNLYHQSMCSRSRSFTIFTQKIEFLPPSSPEKFVCVCVCDLIITNKVENIL